MPAAFFDAGQYPASWTGEATFGTVGDKETPCLKIEFNLTEENAIRTVTLFLSDGAYPYSEEKLKRLGFNGDWEDPKFDKAEDVVLTCKHETYKDETHERWDLGGGGAMSVNPAGKDLVKLLKARWKKAGGNSPGKSSGPPKSKQPKASIEKFKNEANGCDDKDSAWEFWSKHADGDADTWTKAVDKVITENEYDDEASLTASDWGEVAVQAVLPF